MKMVMTLLGIGAGIFVLSALVASPEDNETAAQMQPTQQAPIASERVDDVPCSAMHEQRGYIGINNYDDTLTLGGIAIDVVRVAAVFPGTPAETYGLRPGDAIVSANGTRTYDDVVLKRVLRETGPGREVRFALLRDGEPWVIEVVTAEWSERSAWR